MTTQAPAKPAAPMTLVRVDEKLAQAALRLHYIAAEGDAEKGSGIARIETMLEVDRLLDVRLAIMKAAG